MPGRMPEDMPYRMPEDMRDKMPEDMSDRMPEDLPVTKRIDVMVGITRSKAFFSLKSVATLFGDLTVTIRASVRSRWYLSEASGIFPVNFRTNCLL